MDLVEDRQLHGRAEDGGVEVNGGGDGLAVIRRLGCGHDVAYTIETARERQELYFDCVAVRLEEEVLRSVDRSWESWRGKEAQPGLSSAWPGAKFFKGKLSKKPVKSAKR